MRDAITKTYARSVERQMGPSTIHKVSYGKQAKRMDGDWDVRWVWEIEVGDEKYAEECKWEGFRTLPACLKDLDRAINKIINKENDANKKDNKKSIVKPKRKGPFEK